MSNHYLRKGNFGTYDYQTRCFEINDEILNIPVSRAQEIIDCAGNCNLTPKEMSFMKTYIHEATHFIDSNASLWGGKFTYQLIKSCMNSKASEMLRNNACELLFHSNYPFFYNEILVNRLSMRYTLIYNERLGITPIFLYYNEFEEAINSSPVSLLSLFEAKALLSETIFEYEYHSTRNDYVMKSKCQIDFINNLNNSQDLEYTSFIRFAFQVWGKESFLEVLKALKYILGFSIKIPDVALSSIPVSIIESVFYVCDKKNISSLKMEFSRGEARPALALILIVLFMSSLKSEEFRIHDINLFIQDLFDKYCLKFELVEAMLDLQREVQDECFNSISGDKVIQALRPLSQDLLHDSTNTLYAPLIECIFGFDTLKPINPIKINFDDYQDRNIELIGKIDSNSIINSRRQHLTPNQYHQWLDDMSNNKDPNLRTTWLEG